MPRPQWPPKNMVEQQISEHVVQGASHLKSRTESESPLLELMSVKSLVLKEDDPVSG